MKNTFRTQCLISLLAIAQIFIPFGQTFAAPAVNAQLTSAVAGVNKLHRVGALIKAVRGHGQYALADEMATLAKKAGFTAETALPVFVQKGNHLTVAGYPQPLIVENLFPITIKKGKETWTVKRGAAFPETYKSLVRFLATRQARLDSLFNILIPEVMAEQNVIGSPNFFEGIGLGLFGLAALGFYDSNSRAAEAKRLNEKRQLEEQLAESMATEELKIKHREEIVNTVCSPHYSAEFIARMKKSGPPKLVNVSNGNYERQLYPSIGDANTRQSILTNTWELPSGERETIEYTYTFTGRKNGHDIDSANEFSDISVSAKSRAGMPIEFLVDPPKGARNASYKDVFVEQTTKDGKAIPTVQMQHCLPKDLENMTPWSMDSAKPIQIDNKKLSSFDAYLAVSNSNFLNEICASPEAEAKLLAKNGIATKEKVLNEGNSSEVGR